MKELFQKANVNKARLKHITFHVVYCGILIIAADCTRTSIRILPYQTTRQQSHGSLERVPSGTTRRESLEGGGK